MKARTRALLLTSCWSVLILAVFIAGCAKESLEPPVATAKPVTNVYHGVEVQDDYQWLEDGNDTTVQEWADGQNRFARQELDGIACWEPIAERLRELYNQAHPEYYSYSYIGGQLFAMKKQPPLDQPLLIVMDVSLDPESERIIVNPNSIDTTGRTSIDFFVVSPDARLVAVSLSQGGTEDGDVHVYLTADGEKLPDVVPLVNGPTAGGDVAWLPDASGFFYTHYPRGDERPPEDMRFYQQVYYHELGSSTEADTYVIGEEFPRIAEIQFETSPDNKYVLATVSDGDGGEYAHYLGQPSGKWRQISGFKDKIPTAKFGTDNSIYLLAEKDTPKGEILRLKPKSTNLKRAQTVVPESDRVITDFLPTENYLYVSDLVGGPSQLRIVKLGQGTQREIPIKEVSSVYGLTSLGGDRILYRNSSYVEPTVAYVYEPLEGEPARTRLAGSSIADFSNVEVVREFAQSKDGTRVPMTVLRPKGAKLDGSNPVVLYGYGGYGLSQRPYFRESLSLWLNSGGIYVIANIRGGGEFGEDWHLQGNLVNKQNVFDDFAACAQYLIDTGYTNNDLLAIRGGSNGGLLVGATMTQHPDLFKAVVCQKGVLEMLRVELDPNGAFNVTEFGTVKDPDQFRALYAYSPYHSVNEGVRYPDALFTADDNDWRVNASNSRKMVAHLQAASPQSLTLLRMSTGAGHGIGSSMSDRIAQQADVWAFLFDRLGVDCGGVLSDAK